MKTRIMKSNMRIIKLFFNQNLVYYFIKISENEGIRKQIKLISYI
jgi:hypothetical protein